MRVCVHVKMSFGFGSLCLYVVQQAHVWKIVCTSHILILITCEATSLRGHDIKQDEYVPLSSKGPVNRKYNLIKLMLLHYSYCDSMCHFTCIRIKVCALTSKHRFAFLPGLARSVSEASVQTNERFRVEIQRVRRICLAILAFQKLICR